MVDESAPSEEDEEEDPVCDTQQPCVETHPELDEEPPMDQQQGGLDHRLFYPLMFFIESNKPKFSRLGLQNWIPLFPQPVHISPQNIKTDNSKAYKKS